MELIGASAGKQALQFRQQDIVINFLSFILEKGGWRNFKCSGYAFDHVKRWPLFTSFDFTKVVRTDACPLGHCLTGEVCDLPDRSYSAAKESLAFHVPLTLQAISAC